MRPPLEDGRALELPLELVTFPSPAEETHDAEIGSWGASKWKV